jgi:hypothetical protein
MQILDNDELPDGKIHKHGAEDLYDLIPCKVETAKPFGQWNHAEIISKDGKLTFILNKVKLLKRLCGTNPRKEMIAKSKFNQWPVWYL